MFVFEPPDDKFRASVGVFIVNKQRTAVLTFQRVNYKGSRQFPQGGIKIYEQPLDAAYRELYEETGIKESQLKHLGEYPEWITFELPKKYRSKKHGRGKTQKVVYFEFIGDEMDIDLKQVRDMDFSEFFWVDPNDVVNKTVDYRKVLYKRVVQYFSENFKK